MNIFRTGLLTCVMAFYNMLPAQSPRTGTDYALFFVVQDFDKWTDFPASSTQQVRDIEQELKARYGFQTEFLLNPTRRQILDKLTQYHGRRFGKDDQLLLFFSMHGHYDEGGTGVLIPKDGLLSDPVYDTWITHPLLADLVNRIPCEHILLSLDACYSGTFGGSRGRPDRKAWETTSDCADKCKQALLYKSRLYLTSGGVERTPTDSQFADKWLEALRVKNMDGVLSFHKLFGVLGEAYPVPMFGEFRDHNKGGDFVFVDRSACGPALTDAAHWQQTQRNPERDALLEHLRLFPGCEHEGEVIGLLSRLQMNDKIEKTEPQREKVETKNLTKKNTYLLPKMVLVKAGTFEMGANDSLSHSSPTHKVTVGNFSIGNKPISLKEFKAFIEDSDYKTDAEKGNGSYILEGNTWRRKTNINWQYNHKGELRTETDVSKAVYHISWYDAISYCNWLSEKNGLQKVYTIEEKIVIANWNSNGYRLPTESEWEYAANMSLDKKNWPEGFRETGECIWEWCWDWSGAYTSSSQINPRGPDSGKEKIVRGCQTISFANNYTSPDWYQNRSYYEPDKATTSLVSFRIAKSEN